MRCFYYFVGAFFIAAASAQVSGMQKVIAKYGETIAVPCNNGDSKPADLIFTKWKFAKDDGTSGDLLVKHAQKGDVKISATNGYKDRVSITDNSTLLISHGNLRDQAVFTCMVVSLANLIEYPVEVEVQKRPSEPEIRNKASLLENSKLTPVAECVAASANPPAEIVWVKNNTPLVNNDLNVIITASVEKDPLTGLSTTKSALKYMAEKQDMTSTFACVVKHVSGPDQMSTPEIFSIHYATEKITLQVLPSAGPVLEGDNVTLKCHADGNPPPTLFNFFFKGSKVSDSGKSVLALPSVTRANSGEYRCSLPGNDSVMGSATVTVSYLDLSLYPSGRVVKKVGESLEVKWEKNASSEVKVSWTKDNTRLDKLPSFSSLKYSDAGVYTCEASTAGLKRSASFQLMVEGIPVITSLTKQHTSDGKNKVLVCVAEGSPRPNVNWNVNGTPGESTYNNGKAVYKMIVAPNTNLTVRCEVTNDWGTASKNISVSPLYVEPGIGKQDKSEDGEDKAKLIIGVVVGLIVVAALVGIIYWLYMRRRQGSWKTGEKEAGTSEESKKLEENNHRPDV